MSASEKSDACTFCQKVTPHHLRYRIHTARCVRHRATVGNFNRVWSTFSDFEEHDHAVCGRCLLLWGRVTPEDSPGALKGRIPRILFSLSFAAFIPAAVGIFTVKVDGFLLLLLGGIPLFLLGVFLAYRVRLIPRLKRKAISARRKGGCPEPMQAFSEWEYDTLMRKQPVS